jgi:16S rRNA (cytidine1402-2'-O)-methyltransferase
MDNREPIPGVLYVVATPIGNLEDITLRAIEILKGVDWIAAEDTRRSRILLERFGIRTKLISCYGDIEKRRSVELIDGLERGEKGAVISDAGTPGASDPGGRVVAAAAARGIRVVPIPGASALAVAVSVAGFESARFVFEGFLPRTGEKRRSLLESLAGEERHIIFFESAKRITATLADFFEHLGNRKVVIMRELTKIHEEIIRASLQDIAEKRLILKEIGEYTVVVEGGAKRPGKDLPGEVEKAAELLSETELAPGTIAKIINELYGASKNKIYQFVVEKRKN